jgi:hypothetical protein
MMKTAFHPLIYKYSMPKEPGGGPVGAIWDCVNSRRDSSIRPIKASSSFIFRTIVIRSRAR